MTRLPVRQDGTSCVHDVREHMGVYQCCRCSRLFDDVSGVWVVQESVEVPVDRVCAECGDILGGSLFHLDDEAEVCIPCWQQYPAVLLAHGSRMVCTMARLEVKLDQIRAMLPDLGENRATKGAARKLRSILEGAR